MITLSCSGTGCGRRVETVIMAYCSPRVSMRISFVFRVRFRTSHDCKPARTSLACRIR